MSNVRAPKSWNHVRSLQRELFLSADDDHGRSIQTMTLHYKDVFCKQSQGENKLLCCLFQDGQRLYRTGEESSCLWLFFMLNYNSQVRKNSFWYNVWITFTKASYGHFQI